MKQVRNIRQKLSRFWLWARTKTLHSPFKRSENRTRARRQGRIWKLALTLALIALLFSLSWYLQGCPCFSRNAAFRKALRNIGRDGVPVELTIDRRDDALCLGTDGQYAYVASIKADEEAKLFDTVVTWQPGSLNPRIGYGACAWAYPTVDGVCFVPGMTDLTDYRDFRDAPTEPDENGRIHQHDGEFNENRYKIAKKTYGFVLVRVPAERIEMTMVLEPRTYISWTAPGGAFAMKTDRLEGDWFRCDFDPEYVPVIRYNWPGEAGVLGYYDLDNSRRPSAICEREDWTGRTGVPDLHEADDYYSSVIRYARGEYDDRVRFILTAYDKNDEVIQTVTCYPKDWDRGF